MAVDFVNSSYTIISPKTLEKNIKTILQTISKQDEYKDIIDQCQFNDLYKSIESSLHLKANNIITYILLNAEIDPLRCVDSVVRSMYKGLNITEIYIPNYIKSIGQSAFEGCIDLKNVSIAGGNIDRIAKAAFTHCTSLEIINIPAGVKYIDEGAFNYCQSLKTVTLPDSLKSIGRFAFMNCSSLEDITLPKNLDTIKRYAFSGCKSLQSITIPSSVKHLSNSAFDDCRKLKHIYYDGTEEQFEELLLDYDNIGWIDRVEFLK